VALRAVESAPELPTLARLTLLFGTEEVEVRLRLLDCEKLEPGRTALAQLRSAVPVSLPARERFILRRASPPQTVAGGRIIDPAAFRLRRNAPAVLARLGAIAACGPAEIVQVQVAAAGAAGVALGRLAQLAGISEARAAEYLQALPVVLGRSRVAVLQAEFEKVLAGLPRALAGREEVPLDRVAALLPSVGPEVLADAVGELVRRGTLLRVGGAVRVPAPQRDRERADAETASAVQLAEVLRRGGLTPPDPLVLAPGVQTKRLVDRLVREGVLIRALDRVQKREVFFHQDAIEVAKRRLAPLLVETGGLLVGEAGAALGISRKYCVPLLEHLDSVRFTRRIADRRILA